MLLRLASLSPVTWMTIEKAAQQVLWLTLFVVLAPILGPHAYGLFSIVMVFVGFCEFVLSEGAIEALVSIDKLERRHIATANLVSVAMAIGLGCLLFALAPAIAEVFDSNEISSLVSALIPLPVLSLLSAIPIAHLRRSLQYRRLAMRTVTAFVCGGVCGIMLAVSGAGVWALVGQVLAQRTVEVLIAWGSVPLQFRLGWSAPHFHDMKSVALNVFAARAMVFGYGQVPRLIIGLMLGPTVVGLYTMASRFLETIMAIIVLPYAAVGRIQLREWDPTSWEFERHFSIMLQNASILSLPILVGTAALIPNLFQIWLDEHWLPGVIPAQLVVLSGLPVALFYCCDAAFLAAKLSRVFKWTAAVQGVTIALTVLCLSPFGLVAVCAGLALRPWALVPLYLLLLRRHFGWLRYKTLVASLQSLVGALLMGTLLSVPFLRKPWFGQTFELIMLISIGALFFGLFSFGFMRSQLKTLLAGIFIQRPGQTLPPGSVERPNP